MVLNPRKSIGVIRSTCIAKNATYCQLSVFAHFWLHFLRRQLKRCFEHTDLAGRGTSRHTVIMVQVNSHRRIQLFQSLLPHSIGSVAHVLQFSKAIRFSVQELRTVLRSFQFSFGAFGSHFSAAPTSPFITNPSPLSLFGSFELIFPVCLLRPPLPYLFISLVPFLPIPCG